MKMLYTMLLGLAFFTQLSAQVITSPPPAPVRTMAEWEECGALVVTWRSYFTILTEIIKVAQSECKVIVCCDTQASINEATTTLTNAGIEVGNNVQVALVRNNTVWVRDFGPTSVYYGQVDSMVLVDWIYNRSRWRDDTVSQRIGQLLGHPVFSTKVAPYDLVNTGGNFMSDGIGTAFASELVFRNNDLVNNGETGGNDIFGTSNHTEAGIDSIMRRFMGIEEYIKLEELPYDGIHHLDMHIKLLDEETLLVGKYPEGISDGPQLEANLQYILSNYQTAAGRPFKVVRIPMPPFNGQYPPFSSAPARYPTFTNLVFVNKTVIMPIYNTHPLNGPAQDTLKKYLPGYKVVGVDCTSIIDAGGAVHCITKEIGVPDPLRIVHFAIRSADVDQPSEWRVVATVQHRSGIASAELFYTSNLAGPWSSVGMVFDNTLGQYVADIPVQPNGTQVYYYIKGMANNGKTMHRPMPAPEGYWSFKATQSSAVDPKEVASIQPIFPNPARAITVVPIQMKAATVGVLSLYNAQGQWVETLFEGQLATGATNYFIHADRYPAGTYQVVLQTAQQHAVQQIVIVK
jgi:agmatine deiminase